MRTTAGIKSKKLFKKGSKRKLKNQELMQSFEKFRTIEKKNCNLIC